ncbi:hypothetical protein RJ639_036606, partial [Escallonia herrerae]
AVVLLDTGNLVLGNELNVVWQSFDHPTDTFLPGGKLGLDKSTNRSQVLTSWRSSDDPSSGNFSFGIDPSGSTELIIWRNRSERYWESGAWNGETFSSAPEMTVKYIYNYSYVSNEKIIYFTYDLYNKSITSRFVLDTSGQEAKDAYTLHWRYPFSFSYVVLSRVTSGYERSTKKAWEFWENDRVLELVDPTLDISSSSCMPVNYVAVGVLCVQQVPSDRPCMSEVVAMLSNEHLTVVSPKRPAFTPGRTPLLTTSGRGQAEMCSVNNLKASVLKAR